jgi:N-acetylneuraminic acid mutarotase
VGSAIYVLGGNIGENEEHTASVLKFDDTQGTWNRVAPMPEARNECPACVVGTDIYVFGGFDGEDEEQASVFKYDTEANSWSVLAPMPSAPCGHCVSVLDGLIYIVGFGIDGRQYYQIDPLSGVWSALAPALNSRLFGTSFVLGGSLYAAGGIASLSTVERYDVSTDTWTAVADMLEPRRSFGAVTLVPKESTEEQDLFDLLIAKAIRKGR